MDNEHLERIRTICLSLPGTSEKPAWGAPTFRAGGKMFAMYAAAGDHHGDGRRALWCHAPEGSQLGLVEAAPDRFFVPPYVGKNGWIGIWLDTASDLELHVHVREAYRVIASSKLLAQLDDEEAG